MVMVHSQFSKLGVSGELVRDIAPCIGVLVSFCEFSRVSGSASLPTPHSSRRCPLESPPRDRHSVLRVSADWVMCEDVGSLNGTFVNEDKLEGPSKVVAGDVLQFGQSAVRICVV